MTDKLIDSKNLDVLVSLLLCEFPDTVPVVAIEETARLHLGKTYNSDQLLLLAHNLAGNEYSLQHGVAVVPWRVQLHPEWCPIQILRCRRHKTAKKKIGAVYTAKILAGSPAGLDTEFWWPSEFAHVMSGTLGFTRARGKRLSRFPYTGPEDFVTLRLYGLFTPQLSVEQPKFHEVRVDAKCKEWNTTQLKYRNRVDEAHACPKKMPLTLACKDCIIGYESCRAGTHKYTYYIGECEVCGKDAYFDKELSSTVCVSCVRKRAYKR